MSWPAFILTAWVLFGLEIGLKQALGLGTWGVAPSFVVPLAVFISMGAPAGRAVWACLILGIGLDLTWSPPVSSGPAPTIIGPYALGLALAGQLVLALRSMMIRRNPLTLAFLAFAGSGVMHLMVVAMFTARSLMGDPIVWNAGSQLLSRLGSSAYTALAAFVLALLLIPMSPLFGFHLGQGRYGGRRG